MAVKGSAVLEQIDSWLARTRRFLDESARETAAANDERRRLELEELALLRSLAALRMHLSDPESGRADGITLGIAAHARTNRERLGQLEREIESVRAACEAKRGARPAWIDAVIAAEAELGARVHEIDRRLERGDAYRALREAARRLASQAARGFVRSEQAEADRAEKAKPYEQDALFQYLWRRRFGTPEGARGSLLLRMLDGWVARSIGYEAAGRNYETLVALPERLRRHAEALEERGSIARDELIELRRRALESGDVPALIERFTEGRKRLREGEAALREAEVRLAELEHERDAIASGDDATERGLLDQLAKELRRLGDEVLEAQAHRTPSLEDDAVVEAVKQVRKRSTELHDRARRLTEMHQGAGYALEVVDELRARFRTEGLDTAEFHLDSAEEVLSVLTCLEHGQMDPNEARAWLRERCTRPAGPWSRPQWRDAEESSLGSDLLRFFAEHARGLASATGDDGTETGDRF